MRCQIRRSRSDSRTRPSSRLCRIAQTAVNQFGIMRAGCMRKIVALDQRDRESAQARIPRDCGARDSSADDEKIEDLVRKPVQIPAH